ncbi:MarC family protein [Methanocaldococcus indicus]|uniref:MarC family protein n=1 Tax=Methanocaldococcus indicus TaxID=213231 RepID=UPI003C6CCD2A
MDINYFLYSFVSIFITVDPIGLLPMIHSLLINYSEDDRKKIIKKAIFISTIVLLTFAIFGKYIFAYFGITMDSFKVAGGLLLLKISWDMLQAEIPKTKHKPDEKIEGDIDSIAYVPLAIPLISGPGAITTTMILVGKSTSLTKKLEVILAIILVMLISYILMYFSDKILSKLNIYGINAFVRIMGLLLMAISVQIIFSGVSQLI